MKRLVVVGVGLLLAPLAWSAGALETHEEGALAASIADTWSSLFGEEQVELGRDLSGLAMVPRQHQRGVGHRVTLDQLDDRASDRVFHERIAQQAANQLMRERMKPFVSDGLADDVMDLEDGKGRLQRLYTPRVDDANAIMCGGGVQGIRVE